MNNKNLSNPIYQKLFPETYEKNSKIQIMLASMKDRFRSNAKIAELFPEMNNEESIEIDS